MQRLLAQLCAYANYAKPDGLSIELITTICHDIDRIKEEGRLDNDTFRTASNTTRCEILGNALLALRSSRKAASTATAAADPDQDARFKLMKSPGFKDLTQAVDDCGKGNFTVIATVMLRAVHPGGLAHVSGKTITTFNELAAVRINPVLDDIMKRAVNHDISGKYGVEWDTITSGAMKKFVNGDWSAETIFTLHLAKLIAKRDGTRVLNEYQAQFASGKWWIDARLLDVAKAPLHAVMALIGYGGSTTTDSSFAQFYDGMQERAKRLGNLEIDLLQRPMLEKELLDIACSAMKEAATVHALMLTMPPHLMQRPRSFINENGACAALAGSFDKHITKVEEDKDARSGAYDKAPVQAVPRLAQAKRERDEPREPWQRWGNRLRFVWILRLLRVFGLLRFHWAGGRSWRGKLCGGLRGNV